MQRRGRPNCGTIYCKHDRVRSICVDCGGARYAGKSDGRNVDYVTEQHSAPMENGNQLAVNVLLLHFVCTTETSTTVLIVELSKLSKLQNSHRHCVPTAGLNLHAPNVTARGYVFIKSKRQRAASVEMQGWWDAGRCTAYMTERRPGVGMQRRWHHRMRHYILQARPREISM